MESSEEREDEISLLDGEADKQPLTAKEKLRQEQYEDSEESDEGDGPDLESAAGMVVTIMKPGPPESHRSLPDDVDCNLHS